MPEPTLLEVMHRMIERTFLMRTGIASIERFVLGDRGYARLYRQRPPLERVGSAAWPEAAVLVREVGQEVRAAIYYPDSLISALERHNPLHGLDGDNLGPFAVFVEELDHLLTLADRRAAGRCASLFELELHAGVTKHVASRHFLERTAGRRLAGDELGWLRARLFESAAPASSDPAVRARYLDADRLAARYCRWLEGLTPAARLAEVRGFHHLGAAAAVRRIEGISV